MTHKIGTREEWLMTRSLLFQRRRARLNMLGCMDHASGADSLLHGAVVLRLGHRVPARLTFGHPDLAVQADFFARIEQMLTQLRQR